MTCGEMDFEGRRVGAPAPTKRRPAEVERATKRERNRAATAARARRCFRVSALVDMALLDERCR